MKVPDAWPRLMRPEVAAAYCGGQVMLEELISRFGLSPIRQRHRLTIYLKDSIDAAINLAATSSPHHAPGVASR